MKPQAGVGQYRKKMLKAVLFYAGRLFTYYKEKKWINYRNEKSNSFSLIKAEYLLSTPYKSSEIYIFLDKKDDGKQYFCRSFFPKENRDYTIGQASFTLLFKEKITLSTGEREIQYDKLSPMKKD